MSGFKIGFCLLIGSSLKLKPVDQSLLKKPHVAVAGLTTIIFKLLFFCNFFDQLAFGSEKLVLFRLAFISVTMNSFGTSLGVQSLAILR
jgi:hypothetical protein